ncbi:MAG: hypothetical protein AAFP19_18855 [Bacteroidota bacterium]
MRSSILIITLILSFGCQRNPYIIDSSKLDINENEQVIIDLSQAIDFETKTNNLLIKDARYVAALVQYLIESNRTCKLLYQSNHGDRFYIQTQLSSIKTLKENLVSRGVKDDKIKAWLGLDFGEQYSKYLARSKVIVIID